MLMLILPKVGKTLRIEFISDQIMVSKQPVKDFSCGNFGKKFRLQDCILLKDTERRKEFISVFFFSVLFT